MALDEALLNRSIGSDPVAKVRLYGWDRPTLSTGAHVPVDHRVPARCSDHGVALLRRPTGGGAVMHSGDLTYSVVAPIVPGNILDCYVWVAEVLVAGFAELGIQADVVQHGARADSLACFAKPTGADLQAGGRKICGSAQLRRGGRFLQHGSIPIPDVRSLTHALLGTDPGGDSSTCLADFGVSGWLQVAEGILGGFEKAWGPPDEVRPPTVDEQEETSRLLNKKYPALLNPIGLV